MKKNKEKKKLDHPYLNLRNWLPGGRCCFWNDNMHNAELYNRTIEDEVEREKSLVVFQENIQR